MTFGPGCTRAEILAGAIALGEASDAQRHEYREHLSICPHCLSAIGGEHEIERTIGLVTRARDEERWQPDIRNGFVGPAHHHAGWQWAAGLAIALVLFVALAVTQHSARVETIASVPLNTELATKPDARAIASLGTQALQRREHRAESLAFIPAASTHRTITFQVRLDEHGKPVHCAVVKGSSNVKLGASFCHSVMRTH